MKLLLDQNISYRLIRSLEETFPGSEQVKRLGLENKTDFEIWEYAKRQDFNILTFDSDFYDLSLLYGHPPKIIWVRSNNQTTSYLDTVLKKKSEQIKLFMQDNALSCLEIVA